MRLEGLDQLFGEEQRKRMRRGILLNRDWPAVETSAAYDVAAGREPCAPREDIPDGEHDAEVGVLDIGRVVQPVVGGLTITRPTGPNVQRRLACWSVPMQT